MERAGPALGVLAGDAAGEGELGVRHEDLAGLAGTLVEASLVHSTW